MELREEPTPGGANGEHERDTKECGRPRSDMISMLAGMVLVNVGKACA
jgi:hypothetical protein